MNGLDHEKKKKEKEKVDFVIHENCMQITVGRAEPTLLVLGS